MLGTLKFFLCVLCVFPTIFVQPTDDLSQRSLNNNERGVKLNKKEVS